MLFYIFVFSSGSIWYNFSLIYHSWILYYILTAIDELKNLKSIQLSHGICGGSAAIPWTVAQPGSSVHGILQARILDGLPFPSPGDLPNWGFEPRSLALQADSLPSKPLRKPWGISRDTQIHRCASPL